MFEWLSQDFMIQALFACGAMGILLAYLGVHVVGRGIVFVDLALGQISSLGVAFALYAGKDPVIWSMAFTILGAIVFSVLHVEDTRLRLEAIIGIFYAVASAATVLLIAKTPHGDADIQDVLFGNVLALDAKDLHRMLLVFGLVALMHAVLAKPFFLLTYRKGAKVTLTRRDRTMNLLFYLSLAFAIVFAIRAGGVIPVFSFLIIPPVMAILLARRNAVVIPLTLLAAAVASFGGLHLSYVHDLPAGASIVAVLGFMIVVAAAIRWLTRWRAARVAAGVALVAISFATPAKATSGRSDELASLKKEIADLKATVATANTRIEDLESRLADLSMQAPAPAASGAPSFKLIDISLDGLFTAGSSTADEAELRRLDFGGHDPKNRGFTLQNLELTLAGAVDPYMRADANIVMQLDPAGESTLEVEEAYLTTLSLPASLQVRAGTFFTSFGRLNPTHPHTWDFADQPVINSRLFGPDGLRGPGAELAWLLPTPFFAEFKADIQNSNGETATSFRFSPGEEVAGHPITNTEVKSAGDLLYTGRFRTSFDPTDNWTLVPGLSYVTGPNGTGGRTAIGGVDLYAKWKPIVNDHGWPYLAIQAEAIGRRYEARASTTEEYGVVPAETLKDSGGYLQAVWGFKRRFAAGLRYDFAQARDGDPEDPLRDSRRRISTDVTFHPSEFSKLRLQLNRDFADHLTSNETSVFFQFEFLFGAHGAHKF